MSKKDLDTYEIEVLETLSRVVEIDAADISEAIETVQTMYDDEQIVLDADDFADVQIADIHRDVVTPLADRVARLIRGYVAKHYGDSEADNPSWEIRPLAEHIARELA